MSKNVPKVSILTASYNYSEYIKETIESVIKQSFQDWEMIIVDDGSKDNSVEVIKSYCQKDARIKLFQHKNGQNKGLAKTLQLGIKNAQSEWIAFLEADDTIVSDYLSEKFYIIEKYPNVDFIFNDVNMFGDSEIINKLEKCHFSKVYPIIKNIEYPNNMLKVFQNFEDNAIPTFSVVMLRKKLLKGVRFDSPVKPSLDWYIWLQIIHKKKYNFFYIDKKLTNWRMHGNSYNHIKCTKNEFFLFDIKKNLLLFKYWNLFNVIRRKIIKFNYIDKKIIFLEKEIKCKFIFRFKKECHLDKTEYEIKQSKVKWGVSYSVFDGEELLEASIKSIRASVDYINVVYQLKSWYGESVDNDVLSFLHQLKDNNLIDEIIEYKIQPELTPPQQEINKRNIGLQYAKKFGVNYFMTMDCDEFYIRKEVEKAKSFIIKNDITHSYCDMYSYFSPTLRILDSAPSYVNFFSKVNHKSKLVFFNKKQIALCDPTRQMNDFRNSKYYFLNSIAMHHMTLYRKDIKKKVRNSTAKKCFNETVLNPKNCAVVPDLFDLSKLF